MPNHRLREICVAKPFLRWAGSKRQLVGVMAEYWTGERTRYVEPFAGSARFFFRLEPPSALLGDLNADLISMYGAVKAYPTELYVALRQWENSKKDYYRARELDLDSLSEVDKAARFIYLNRFCFNGLYRTNKVGKFNVPYGGSKTGATPSQEELKATSRLLARVTLKCGDFETTLTGVDDRDFIYLDPPFTTNGKRVFNDYGPQSFGSDDLCRLRRVLETLHGIGAAFLLSYADCPEGRELARNFKITEVTTKRNIAGFASRRRVTTELLVTNVCI